MQKNNKEQRKLMMYTYLFIIVCFTNLTLLQTPYDYKAIYIGGILILLLSISGIVLRRFFPMGDKYLFIFANLLCAIGITMIYRMNPKVGVKQLVWVIIGIIIFMSIIIIVQDVQKFSKYRYWYMAITIILMSLGTFFGKEVYGAKNWIKIAGISVQPSEFGKIALVAYLSSALYQYDNKIKKFALQSKSQSSKNNIRIYGIKLLIEPAAVVMLCLLFMVLQTDLGSALLLFFISVTMLYIATSKGKYVFWCLGLFAVGSVISYYLFPHVKIRVQIWLDPWKYVYGPGGQIVQSLIAISSGGLFGSGLGFGTPQVIPVVLSDFIFSAVCEEMGIAVGIGMILIYFLMFYRGMRASIKADNNFLKLLGVGFSTMITTQVLVIVAGVIGAIPLTGVTLPFVSAGGSSMLVMYFSLGVIQKISEGDI